MVPHEGYGTTHASPFDSDNESVMPLACPEVDGTIPEKFIDNTPVPNLFVGVRFTRDGHGIATGTDEKSAAFNLLSLAHDDRA